MTKKTKSGIVRNNPADDIIEQGLRKNLIRLYDDNRRIGYVNHGISRDYTKPEAIIEARAYLSLVLLYDYPEDRIQLFAAEAEKSTAELREELERQYSDKVGELLPDEEIFMAIAEDIGFDATGKPTKVNELDEIGVALADFIKKEAEA